jgi:hypothetical protein
VYAKSPASIKMRGLFVSAVCAMVAVRCTSSTIVPVVTEQSLQSGVITISNDRLLLHFIVALQQLVEKSSKIGVDKMNVYTVI